MIGVVVYRLRAENSARLPLFHGRLLHGAIFSLLREYSEVLTDFIHNEMNSKPFTVSLLTTDRERDTRAKDFLVEKGGGYYLRLTALHDHVLEALLLAFTGRFSYLLTELETGAQTLLLMLAQFSVFAGVGRLTAQGFGRTRVEFKEMKG